MEEIKNVKELILAVMKFIKKELRKGLNILEIIDEDKMIFKYMSQGGGPYSHQETIKIDVVGENDFTINWSNVIDSEYAHYTPDKLSFNDVYEFGYFLEKRYLEHSWELYKHKRKRYYINDGIDDVPQYLR